MSFFKTVYYVNNNNNNNICQSCADNKCSNAIHNNNNRFNVTLDKIRLSSVLNRTNTILVPEGPFCFCMNANNNTYSCLRTINATHNFLYCEFVTGLVTFYNLRIGKIMNNPHIWFVFHVSKNLVSIHIHFIYILVEVDQREFAYTCTYHILVCFSQNGHILSCFCFFIWIFDYFVKIFWGFMLRILW